MQNLDKNENVNSYLNRDSKSLYIHMQTESGIETIQAQCFSELNSILNKLNFEE